MDILVEIGYALIDALITILLIKYVAFNDIRIGKKRVRIYYSVLVLQYLILTVVGQPLRMMIHITLFIILNIIFMKISFKSSLKKTSVLIIMVILIALSYQVIITKVLDIQSYVLGVGSLSPIRIGAYVYSLLIAIVVCRVYRCFHDGIYRVLGKLFLKSSKKIIGIFLMITCLLPPVMLEVLYQKVLVVDMDRGIKNYILVWGFYTILLTVIIVFIFSVMMKQKSKIDRSEFEFEQLKSYSELFEGMAMEFSRYKHDFKNTILPIEGFIIDEDFEGLKKYYHKDILGEQRGIEEKYKTYIPVSFIKNSGLKGLIISKINRAFYKDMKVQIEIFEEIDIPELKTRKICEVVGILMDNAIEAAETSRGREVSLAAMKYERYVTIIIANTYDVKPNLDEIFKNGYSTKGKGRGIGLYVVGNILKKDDSMDMKISFNGNTIYQELIIARM